MDDKVVLTRITGKTQAKIEKIKQKTGIPYIRQLEKAIEQWNPEIISGVEK